ncbi:hypothetical protein Tco_0004759 [Tanacetum coccineum]
MEQENLQQAALDESLVPIDDQVKIGACNMRIDLLKTQKEPTYHLTLDIIKQYSCYNAFLIIADEFAEQPPPDALVSFVKQLGYKGAMKLVSEMYINNMYQPWRTFLAIINRKISNISLTADKPVLRDENRCLIPDSPKSSSITSSLNTIHYLRDTALSSTLSNSMMNDDNRNSAHYMMYLVLSTNTKEKKKKATTPRKKRSITADDNILPDPDEALKLGESMSLTEAEIEEEERRLHETHAHLSTGYKELGGKKVRISKPGL